MTDEKLTYEDLKRYEFVLGKVPSLLLGTTIRTNANLVGKFEHIIVPRLNSLNEVQKKHLDILLNSSVEDIQNICTEAYQKSGKKQYKQLAQPKAAKFIEKNIGELEKLVKNKM